MNSLQRIVHVAIPAMDEAARLPDTLTCLSAQKLKNFHVWVCVNQPDAWWYDDFKKPICFNNKHTLNYLNHLKHNNLHVIDHSSTGKGWGSKSFGVGQARKTIMEHINNSAADNDIIVSMDADTEFSPDYLQSVIEVFNRYPQAVALSNPYYHKISGDDALDRAMLRYEIYMRHYAINMWRIGSPYCFTALGSAIAVPLWAYRKVGGITPKKSGEDFYFLQKLRKTGWICNYNSEKVYPATRYSDRVFFGTGPALIKGRQGDWSSYPIYDHRLFNQVKRTCELFPNLYHAPVETPMSGFLKQRFREEDPFKALRKNAASVQRFVAACYQKIDGLRILQFLKSETNKTDRNDEACLLHFLNTFYPELFQSKTIPESTTGFSIQEAGALKKPDFNTSSISMLDKLRNVLQGIETEYQKNDLKCIT